MSETTTTTQTYCIISDVKIDTHDAQVRLYWDGDYWNDYVDSSLNYPSLEAANTEALKARGAYPKASIQVLVIHSEFRHELIDIYNDDAALLHGGVIKETGPDSNKIRAILEPGQLFIPKGAAAKIGYDVSMFDGDDDTIICITDGKPNEYVECSDSVTSKSR